jgi:catechol 2,3-dioxygenase-like lactoylglutathione lyase family enzyme
VRLVSLSTMLCVRDVARSVAWYRDKLGFEVLKSEPEIALLRLDSGFVYLFAESPPTEDKPSEHLVPKPGGVILVLTVEDCREAYEELKARGVEFVESPEERPYGIDSSFRDPSGNQFRLTQVREGVTA